MWQLLYEHSNLRVVLTAIIIGIFNVLILMISAFTIVKKSEFDYKRKSSAIILIIIIIDYVSFFSLRRDYDVILKSKNENLPHTEGEIAYCKPLKSGGRSGGTGAAEIYVNGTKYWVDNFVNWEPCTYLSNGKHVRVRWVISSDGRNIVISIENFIYMK